MNPETKRGLTEAFQHFAALRERWPSAFPAKPDDVRPLASDAVDIVKAEMGWTQAYARAVLKVWKQRIPYCRAVLLYPTRIDLDGSTTDEIVDDVARANAQATIEWREARKLQRKAATRDYAEKEGLQERRALPP
jgi:sRNA-binding protein